jgi:hypothetical protein
MSSNPTSLRDADELVKLGKSTLRLLEMREQAVKIGAARLQLESILSDAEHGDVDQLRNWLSQHGELLERDDLQHLSTFLPAEDRSQRRVDMPTALSSLVDSVATIQPQALSQPINTAPDLPTSVVSAASTLSVASAKDDSKPIALPTTIAETNKSDKASIDIAKTIDTKVKPSIKDSVALVKPKSTAKPLPKVAFNVDQALAEEQETKSKRAIRWLSGSLGISVGVHLFLTVGLGLAYYTIIKPPEPMRITSSQSETVELLEAPVELEQLEEMEVTEVSTSMPMPAVTTSAESVAATSVVSSDLGVGELVAPISSPVGSAISEAAGAVGGTGNMPGAQFFGVAASGNTFAFVVDNSGSIGPVFPMVKVELLKTIASLKPTQRFYVSFFGKDLQVMELEQGQPSEYAVYATPENIQKLAVWVNNITTQQGRFPLDALDAAIEVDPDAIYLMFDGATSRDSLLKDIEEINRVTDLISGTMPKCAINTIRFAPSKRDEPDEPKLEALMMNIAKENGGSYRYVPKPPK